MRMKKGSTLSLWNLENNKTCLQRTLSAWREKDPERENAEGDSKKVNKKRKNSVLDPRAVVVER